MARRRERPQISEIVDAAARNAGIAAQDVTNFDMRNERCNLARLSVIFVAARAAYSNQEIADTLGYKSATTVSSQFEKAQKQWVRCQENDAVFVGNVRKIAGEMHVDL